MRSSSKARGQPDRNGFDGTSSWPEINILLVTVIVCRAGKVGPENLTRSVKSERELDHCIKVDLSNVLVGVGEWPNHVHNLRN